MGKVEQLDNALQEEDERWAIEVQELNGASRQNLQTLENQLTNSLKAAREVLRNVGAVRGANAHTLPVDDQVASCQ